jgi:hypothetical protein
MDAAVKSLQMAARRLQLSGNLDQSEYARMMSRLREVTDELGASERRAVKQNAEPVNYTELLLDATAAASQPNIQRGIAMQLPGDITVEGPAQDLRDLICCLMEYALTVARDPIALHAEIKCDSNNVRAVCATELLIQSSDVPDFLRRKLWDTVGKRRGEYSVILEPECCRIRFTLPVERRMLQFDAPDGSSLSIASQ